jgi:hypothetical protein
VDGWERRDHFEGDRVAGKIGIEAAEDIACLHQRRKPSWPWSGSGGGDDAVVWKEDAGADGVDRRLAKDCLEGRRWADREEAEIFTRTWRHAPPGGAKGAAQFCADRGMMGVTKHEHGVGAGVGVEVPGADQRFNRSWREVSFTGQIACDPREVAGLGCWQSQLRSSAWRCGDRRLRVRAVPAEPGDGVPKGRWRRRPRCRAASS